MRYIRILAILVVIVITGCRRGDFKATIVMAGQNAPHAGFNVGPDLWVEAGEPCPVTGAVIWIKGAEPNDVFGE